MVWKIMRVVYRENPDTFYSRHWPTKIPTAFAGRLVRKKVVLSEANSLIYSTFYKDKGRASLYLKGIACRLEDTVVAVSQGVANGLEQLFNIDSKIKVIYNGFDLDEIKKKSMKEPSHP
jgi:glycosyltransferase involved in cell wall biosynthesis